VGGGDLGIETAAISSSSSRGLTTSIRSSARSSGSGRVSSTGSLGPSASHIPCAAGTDHWSTARVAGTTFAQPDAFCREVEHEVRFANITIIEGTGASQLGIGVAAARIAEMIGRDERAVIPIGSYQETYGVTLSLPSRLSRDGLAGVFVPTLTETEALALDASAATLREAVESVESRA
jgi:hypothetical protein